MKGDDVKLNIIETLREMPLISYAAKRNGISRSTFYRWLESDLDFKTEVNKASTEGHARISDMAESKLVKLIEDKNLSAIKYYLSHNNRRYIPRHSSPETTKDLLAGETCMSCGLEKPKPMSSEDLMTAFEDMGHVLGYEIKKKL